MRFRILGPLELWRDGQLVFLAPKQRVVLAALLLRANQVAPAEWLIEQVWGEQPPATAIKTLHNLVMRLRRVLPAGALVTRAPGYLLEVAPQDLDLHCFQQLSAEAAAAAGQHEYERAGEQWRAALGLWRGPALAAVDSEALQGDARGLEELRLAALDARIDADLRLGRHAALVAELTGLVISHSLRERFHAGLMLALYRTGRQADALAVYRELRRRLVEELGVEPDRALQTLQRQILTRDPALDPFAAPADGTQTRATPSVPRQLRRGDLDQARGPSPTPTGPAQLPAEPRGFTGRADQLAALEALASTAAEPTTVVISAIAGTAGVGKTALALHWAHHHRQQFPDGQLYVNLRGFDPTDAVMAPATAVRLFLDALEVPPPRIPVDLEAQVNLYRTLLADKRMLVLLDNARDADQIRPLLPGVPGCLVLLTSRNQLASLIATEGAHHLTLDLLTTDEARDLLAHRIGITRVTTEPGAVTDIITACARLPLALTIVAARANIAQDQSLTVLADELRTGRDRLAPLSTGDDPHTDLRAVFSWSYSALTPETARLFRLLGLHPGPDVSTPAMASLAGLPLDQVRPLLGELTRASLLTEHTPGRYGFHDLLRAYAADLIHTHDPPGDRRAAVGRMLDHYLHSAHTAARLQDPTRDPTPFPLTPPGPGVSLEQPAEQGPALAWLTAEHSVLLAAVRLAVADGSDTHAWHLAWTLDTFLDRRGHWHDLAVAWQHALTSAGRLGNPAAQAHAHRRLARAHIRLGRYPDAHTQLQHALDQHAHTGDLAGQAHTHLALSYLEDRQGQSEQALGHAQQALTLYLAAGHRRGQANALNAVGWCHALLGDHQQALSCCEQALALLQDLGDRDGQAQTWHSLGYTHHHLGQHAQAASCYQHALHLFRDLGDRYQEADILTRLGEIHDTAGDATAARTAWTHALEILTDLDHPDADQLRAKLDTQPP